MSTFTPVLFTSLKNYTRKTFRADLFAGLTVGVVALPLSMAFAIACGLSPARGLYTAIVAGFLIAICGGSKVQVSGPTGAFVVIISGVVIQYGEMGLLISTLMAGAFLILFGLFRMGALIRFIPFPVTTGFTTGIAVVIFTTQIKDILGLQIPHAVPADFISKWGCYLGHLSSINWAAFGIAILTVAIIMMIRRHAPKLPAMLIAMLAATVISKCLEMLGVDIVTIGSIYTIPRTLPAPSLPEFSFEYAYGLVTPAFTIALLAAIESLLSATVADGMTGERHKPNIELIGQGIGNIGSAFFGGIPATGAIARTATNIKSGAQTPVSAIIHAITLTLILAACATYAEWVPLAALGGILAVVCYNMSELHVFASLLRGPKSDACVLLITFLITVFVDLVLAVEVGVVLAALLFIRRMSEISNVSVITRELANDGPDSEDALSIRGRDVPQGVEVFEIQGPFFFGAVDIFKDTVMDVMHANIRIVVVRMRQVPAIDATGLHVLRDFCNQCRKKGIQVVLSGVHEQPRQVYEKSGFLDVIGALNVCPHIDAALERVRDILRDSPPSPSK